MRLTSTYQSFYTLVFFNLYLIYTKGDCYLYYSMITFTGFQFRGISLQLIKKRINYLHISNRARTFMDLSERHFEYSL